MVLIQLRNNTEEVLQTTMSPQDTDSDLIPISWCPIIPPEELSKLGEHEEDVRKVREVYDDWRASMRHKEIKGSDAGLYLDRIRMLMIGIGIASGTNRLFAETVQSIISRRLRKQTLYLASVLPEDTPPKKAVKRTLSEFFSELKFMRDIDPEEEIKTAAISRSSDSGGAIMNRLRSMFSKKDGGSAQLDDATMRRASVEATRILVKVYVQLLSPDPWGSAA